MKQNESRLPVAFVQHGGGPWPFVDTGMSQEERDAFVEHLRRVPEILPVPPKALVVVSAHWEEDVPTVMSSPHPPMLYDYSGFPPESYHIQWPAPGDPTLATHVRELLESAGFRTAEDQQRGYDHGTFVPLKVMFPDANAPVVQLSLMRDLDGEKHLRMGRALAPLREEGIFIVGSGNTFHNLRAGRSMPPQDVNARSAAFDEWLQKTVTMAPDERDRTLLDWADAPYGRFAHPREEHLIPLMVIAGAAGEDRAEVTWTGTFLGWQLSSFHFGA